jgi:hypothetical protein
MEITMLPIIKQNIAVHPNLKYLSISTPSGMVFVDSQESNNVSIKSVEKYDNNIKIIEENNNSIKLQMCFGGLQAENIIRIIDKTANKQEQYFYVLTAEFID